MLYQRRIQTHFAKSYLLDLNTGQSNVTTPATSTPSARTDIIFPVKSSTAYERYRNYCLCRALCVKRQYLNKISTNLYFTKKKQANPLLWNGHFGKKDKDFIMDNLKICLFLVTSVLLADSAIAASTKRPPLPADCDPSSRSIDPSIDYSLCDPGNNPEA